MRKPYRFDSLTANLKQKLRLKIFTWVFNCDKIFFCKIFLSEVKMLDKIFRSKIFLYIYTPVLFLLACAVTVNNKEVDGAVFFGYIAAFFLIFSSRLTDAMYPAMLLCVFVTRCYDSAALFIEKIPYFVLRTENISQIRTRRSKNFGRINFCLRKEESAKNTLRIVKLSDTPQA